ncbi:MAG: SDR family NAD(P)-dependent oxidoreductase, partial [Actinomycetes bacterium]
MEGKSVIITGAASGQGEATAILAAREGASVVCVDINDPQATVGVITSAGGAAHAITGDTRETSTWDAAVNYANTEYGGIYLLANVAGISPLFDGIIESTEETWQRTIDINLKSVWLGMRAVLPTMVEQGYGRIVNVASLAATLGVGGLSSYTA